MRYVFGLLVACVTFFALPDYSFAQQDPVKWAFSLDHEGDDNFVLTAKASIKDGWYTYSQFTEEGGPVPTNLGFEGEQGHYEAVGKAAECCSPIEGMSDIFGVNVVKFKKSFTITQKLKISDPNKSIEGFVESMACDASSCLPPTFHEFKITPSSVMTSGATTPSTALADAKPAAEIESKPQTVTSAAIAESEKEQQPGLTFTTKEQDTEPEKEEKPEVAEHRPEKPAAQDAPDEEEISDSNYPVMWAVDAKKVEGKTYDLVYTGTIRDGWYTYSPYTSDNGPVPTIIYIDEDADSYEFVGKIKEKGKIKKGYSKLFETDVIKFLPGEPVVLTQRVKFTDVSKPISAGIEFMVCDKEKCLPPKPVDFQLDLSKGNASAAMTDEGRSDDGSVNVNTNLVGGAAIGAGTPIEYNFDRQFIDNSCTAGELEVKEKSNWLIFVLGFGGGLLALLTPCVFPMIPLTVSFFTKGSENRAKGIRNAILYGLSIIGIYTFLGSLITGLLGADALNVMSTNLWFNLAFFAIFLVFAFSFFGFYDLTLPSSWSNKTDRIANKGGLIGIFFMAFTLSIVSFSCTGPIIGTLLVETATGAGDEVLFGRIPIKPIIGMLGFSIALALPFTLFALFPSWLNSLPKSGGWLNSVKVVLGFLEVALAFKFLSVADMTQRWGFLKYELFLGIWIAVFIGLAAYLFGLIKFPHDSPLKKLSIPRFGLGVVAAGFAVYLATGFMYNDKLNSYSPLAALSGLAPPVGYSWMYPTKCPNNFNCYKNFFEGVEYAAEKKLPILLDFTGHGCENCRRMEENVWSKEPVWSTINDNYVLVSLYVDERTDLTEFYTSVREKKMRNVGNMWSDFQIVHFNKISQPYYVLVSYDGTILNKPRAYKPASVESFKDFLDCGLTTFEELEDKKAIGEVR